MANLPKKPSTATVTAVKGHLVTKSSGWLFIKTLEFIFIIYQIY